MADNQWHHVIATRQKSTGALKLYLDGALVASGTGGTASLVAPPALRIGSLLTGINFYQGLLDEVVIIPEVIDSDAVPLLMNSTLQQTRQATRGCWRRVVEWSRSTDQTKSTRWWRPS